MYPHTSVSYGLRLIPIAMILSAVVANEFIITHYISSDAIPEPTTMSNIRQSQAVLLLTGILLLTMRWINVAYNRLVVRIATGTKAVNPLNQLLRNKELRSITVIGLCTIWLICPFVRVSKKVLDWTCSGAEYGYDTIWRESSLIKWVQTHPFVGVIYSNRPDLVYLHTGMSARMSPRKGLNDSIATTADNITQFRKLLKSETYNYLVWFGNKEKSYLYNIEELSSIFDMEILTKYSDGSIYLFKLE